jgi:hypothetical protein
MPGEQPWLVWWLTGARFIATGAEVNLSGQLSPQLNAGYQPEKHVEDEKGDQPTKN